MGTPTPFDWYGFFGEAVRWVAGCAVLYLFHNHILWLLKRLFPPYFLTQTAQSLRARSFSIPLVHRPALDAQVEEKVFLSNAPFAWGWVYGLGGVGKTQLLDGIMRRGPRERIYRWQNYDWGYLDANYLKRLTTHRLQKILYVFDKRDKGDGPVFPDWAPRRPTLIVVDDVYRQRAELTAFMTMVGRAQDAWNHPVRLVLCDRVVFDDIDKSLTVSHGEDRFASILVPPFTPEESRRAVTTFLEDRNQDIPEAELPKLYDWVMHVSDGGRAFFVKLALRAIAEKDWAQASLQTSIDLLRDDLARFTQRVALAGISEAQMVWFYVATLAKRAEWSWDVGAEAGNIRRFSEVLDGADCRVGPQSLEPDISGGFFLLDFGQSLVRDRLRTCLRLSWQHRPEETADTLLRLHTDFFVSEERQPEFPFMHSVDEATLRLESELLSPPEGEVAKLAWLSLCRALIEAKVIFKEALCRMVTVHGDWITASEPATKGLLAIGRAMVAADIGDPRVWTDMFALLDRLRGKWRNDGNVQSEVTEVSFGGLMLVAETAPEAALSVALPSVVAGQPNEFLPSLPEVFADYERHWIKTWERLKEVPAIENEWRLAMAAVAFASIDHMTRTEAGKRSPAAKEAIETLCDLCDDRLSWWARYYIAKARGNSRLIAYGLALFRALDEGLSRRTLSALVLRPWSAEQQAAAIWLHDRALCFAVSQPGAPPGVVDLSAWKQERNAGLDILRGLVEARPDNLFLSQCLAHTCFYQASGVGNYLFHDKEPGEEAWAYLLDAYSETKDLLDDLNGRFRDDFVLRFCTSSYLSEFLWACGEYLGGGEKRGSASQATVFVISHALDIYEKVVILTANPLSDFDMRKDRCLAVGAALFAFSHAIKGRQPDCEQAYPTFKAFFKEHIGDIEKAATDFPDSDFIRQKYALAVRSVISAAAEALYTELPDGPRYASDLASLGTGGYLQTALSFFEVGKKSKFYLAFMCEAMSDMVWGIGHALNKGLGPADVYMTILAEAVKSFRPVFEKVNASRSDDLRIAESCAVFYSNLPYALRALAEGKHSIAPKAKALFRVIVLPYLKAAGALHDHWPDNAFFAARLAMILRDGCAFYYDQSFDPTMDDYTNAEILVRAARIQLICISKRHNQDEFFVRTYRNALDNANLLESKLLTLKAE